MEFQPWINICNRYLEIVMSDRVYCWVLSSKHTQLSVTGCKASNVTSIYSDIFSSSSITRSPYPTNRTRSGPNRFYVLWHWCFSHVFHSYLKDSHPLFCLIESSALSLRAQLKLPASTFLCLSQARSISLLLWAVVLIIHTWQLSRLQHSICFFICVSNPGSSLMFEQTGRWWRTGKPGVLPSMGSQSQARLSY